MARALYTPSLSLFIAQRASLFKCFPPFIKNENPDSPLDRNIHISHELLWKSKVSLILGDMTWANGVTLMRLALIPFVVLLFLKGPSWLFFLLLALVLLGDLVDGALARWQGQITDLGKALDPLVDKMLFASLFVVLALAGKLSWNLVILLGIPQIALLAGGLVLYQGWRMVVAARWSGKLATVVLSLGLFLLLLKAKLFWDIPYEIEIKLIDVGIFLSYVSGVDYLLNALRLFRRRAS